MGESGTSAAGSGQLSHWERVQAALRGEAVDHAPVSLWRHFPEQDQRAEDLARVSLDWQRRYDFDFVKLMPPGDYATIDWGAVSEYQGSRGGTRQTTHFPVERAEDWARIQPLPVDAGMNRQVLEAARLVNEGLGGEVPVLQTIFSPLTIAMKLSRGAVVEHLRQRPALVHSALEAIAEVTRALTAATLERGASGIFFATQAASSDVVSAEEYAAFGIPYDLRVLEAAGGSRFTLVHLHGDHILFDELLRYPAHAFNWHDRRTPPTLAEGRERSGRAVAGGINEQAIAPMTPAEATAQARDAVTQLAGRGVLVTPGCVIPIDTPAANIAAVAEAVRRG